MDFRLTRIVRYTGLALLTAVGGSITGCWEEVHYEPSKTEQVTDRGARDGSPTSQPVDPPMKPPSALLPESPPMVETGETETSGATIAGETVAGETVDAPKPSRVAQASWQLGSQWSLGAALYAKGMPAERYEPSLEQAASAAQWLHLEFTPLPQVGASQDPVSEVMTYLLDDQGPGLAEKLDEQFDAHHGALMELAIRSHMLLLVYSPRNMAQGKGLLDKEQFQAWIDRLAELADRSRLPEPVWSPLLEGLRKQAPYAEVKRAVLKLHQQVAEDLASAG